MHGVNGTIRKEALESLVEAVHAEIAEAESQALLKALPEGIVFAVDSAVATAGRELLLTVARQHATSQGVDDQTCEEPHIDKRIAQHRVTKLESDLDEEKTARRMIEQECDAITQKLIDVLEELRMARQEIERLGRESASIEGLHDR